MADYKLLIGGNLVDGDMTMDVINPATGEPFCTVPRASAAQADAAIAAAKAAVPGWSAVPWAGRQAKLIELADAIAARKDEIARVLTMEQGKPLAEALGELAWTDGYLRHYATLELPDRVIQDDESGYIAVRHRPLGVVVGIIAWNFPLLVACWKIGPAVLAGNAIVLKPAPTTPVCALILGEICRDVFPAGVVNIITDANDLGPHLTAHPDVAKVGFTGSTATGKRIAASGADTLKRVTLELGGNDPAIVLEDVDVRETAQAIFGNAFLNNGQVCLAVKRAYVHSDIYDAMCGELARLAQAAVVDDGLQQGTQIGPIQNAMQFEKVKGFLDAAREEGTIVAGGEVMERAGYFIRPTIVRDVTDGDRIVDEEQFGPILPLIRFDDVEDVIARANASDYGLGGSVWSKDVARAADIASRIESGQVWVNQHIAIGPHIPMAGFKSSGLGVEQSVEGLAEYTQTQVVNIKR
ncbi:aldehyde dehydrogenase [Novosphingobium aromaticivorans DSM 12444]|jgi:acyl-CoA reductase-like NAD-dependent aldehyde dehydrogenase|uniref:Aldehyde dehydrogenase n=1 Tax=Novosphingobium aromaticivorans (strain ATCC 700278 / DSM 12444 / CCUG 56034 / CIP 105152 / NBRC 16084 / F199) TaxID=279238 RepID=Q2G7P1_NOVAD|nr:aldehyde dehydrogenase family protein [Novosphingobium aromaticivorans]ABD26132.1 aldehyde dehydrogenase [Novosphingobium aromaticivorans DSM 12444]SCY58765.1 Acyl-CoA reductase [Novosphingobium aromaticivorans]